MLSVQIETRGLAGAEWARLFSMLDDRTGLHEAVAERAQEATRDYILMIAPARHKTARDLGAAPTGAMEKTAGMVESRATAEAAVLELPSYIFRRALQDVTIRPLRAKALTIPLEAVAYGTRVTELQAQGWDFFRPKKADSQERSNVLWGQSPSGESKPMYLLVRQVTQRQDRDLLPSDEALAAVGADGVLDYLDQVFGRDLTTPLN